MMMSRESGSLADVQAVTVGVRIKPDLRSLSITEYHGGATRLLVYYTSSIVRRELLFRC